MYKMATKQFIRSGPHSIDTRNGPIANFARTCQSRKHDDGIVGESGILQQQMHIFLEIGTYFASLMILHTQLECIYRVHFVRW